MGNSTMVGLGLTMEGIYQNEVIYEFMMENAYRPKPTNISAWYEGLVCWSIWYSFCSIVHVSDVPSAAKYTFTSFYVLFF